MQSDREKTNKKLDIDTILGYALPTTIVLSLLLIFLLKAVPTGLEPREIIYHGLFGFVLLLWMVNIILICIHVVGIMNYSDISSTKLKKKRNNCGYNISMSYYYVDLLSFCLKSCKSR